jgi:hypothetical protein
MRLPMRMENQRRDRGGEAFRLRSIPHDAEQKILRAKAGLPDLQPLGMWRF